MTAPTVAQKGPYTIDVEKGKTYYWCLCGLSRKQPLCDGSHKRTDLAPLAYVAMETTTVAMCGCKHSKTKPLCDGSHNSL
jgi:CDGSH-type Zn-finger protein